MKLLNRIHLKEKLKKNRIPQKTLFQLLFFHLLREKLKKIQNSSNFLLKWKKILQFNLFRVPRPKWKEKSKTFLNLYLFRVPRPKWREKSQTQMLNGVHYVLDTSGSQTKMTQGVQDIAPSDPQKVQEKSLFSGRLGLGMDWKSFLNRQNQYIY